MVFERVTRMSPANTRSVNTDATGYASIVAELIRTCAAPQLNVECRSVTKLTTTTSLQVQQPQSSGGQPPAAS
jgi:hypothetical protein